MFDSLDYKPLSFNIHSLTKNHKNQTFQTLPWCVIINKCWSWTVWPGSSQWTWHWSNLSSCNKNKNKTYFVDNNYIVIIIIHNYEELESVFWNCQYIYTRKQQQQNMTCIRIHPSIIASKCDRQYRFLWLLCLCFVLYNYYYYYSYYLNNQSKEENWKLKSN